MDAHEPQRRRSRGKSSASSKSKVTVVALWVGLPGSGSCVINANGGLFSDPGARLGDTELHYLAGRDLAGFGWAALSPELAALHHTPSRPALILTDKLLQLGDPGATQAVASALREVGCRTVALVPGLGEWGASSAAGGVRRVEAAEVELVALSYPPSDTVKAAIALMLSSVFVDGAQCNSGPSSRISNAMRIIIGAAHRVLHRHAAYAAELCTAFDYVVSVPLLAGSLDGGEKDPAMSLDRAVLDAVQAGLAAYNPGAPGGVGGLGEEWERDMRAILIEHSQQLRALQADKRRVALGLEAQLRRVVCEEAMGLSEGPHLQPPAAVHIRGLHDQAVLVAAARLAKREGLKQAWEHVMGGIHSEGRVVSNLRVEVWSRLDGVPVPAALMSASGSVVEFRLEAVHVTDAVVAARVSLPGIPLGRALCPYLCFRTGPGVLAMDCASVLRKQHEETISRAVANSRVVCAEQAVLRVSFLSLTDRRCSTA